MTIREGVTIEQEIEEITNISQVVSQTVTTIERRLGASPRYTSAQSFLQESLAALQVAKEELEAEAAKPVMPLYHCHKRVRALEIARVEVRIPGVEFAFNERTHTILFKDENFQPENVKYEVVARYMPVRGDFYVQYEDGHVSISPRAAFIDGYTKVVG